MGVPFVLAHPALAADGRVRQVENFIRRIIKVIGGLAGLVAHGFFVVGGLGDITSSGNRERLEPAKGIIKNALIGLARVLAAATLTAILSHAYTSSGGVMAEKLPTLAPIEPASTSNGLAKGIINTIVGVFRN